MPVSIESFKKVVEASADSDLVITQRIYEKNMTGSRLILHDLFTNLT